MEGKEKKSEGPAKENTEKAAEESKKEPTHATLSEEEICQMNIAQLKSAVTERGMKPQRIKVWWVRGGVDMKGGLASTAETF